MKKLKPIKDLSHGHQLNEFQLLIANELALNQFQKPKNRRVLAKDISELVKKITKEVAN